MKQTTYEGIGIISMLDTCKKYRLFQWNSKLKVDNPTDLNSKWKITVIPGSRDLL